MSCCGESNHQKDEAHVDSDRAHSSGSHHSGGSNSHAHGGCGRGYGFWVMLTIIIGFFVVGYLI